MHMRWLAAVALLLLALLPAQAQRRWSIVPTIGIQVSQIKQNTVGAPLWSIKGGVMGSYRLSSGDLGRIFLESGLLMSKKGLSGDIGLPIHNYRSLAIEVPLLANFEINLTQQVNSFFRIGPYYSRALTESEGIDSNDFGIQVGLGAEYRRWVVAIDGGLGRHNIYEGEQSKAKHINGCLTVGYRF